MKPILIAIAGGSGSGKTWLALQLESRLGSRAQHLCLDDFYRDRSHLTLPERRHLNFDHPRSLDWECYLQAVARLRRGWSASVPVYDFATSNRTAVQRRMSPVPVLIVDGLWPFLSNATRPLYTLTVFLHAPAEDRLGRLLARDPVERARPQRAVEDHFWKHVEPMHQQFVEPQKDVADMVLKAPASAPAIQSLLSRVDGSTASTGFARPKHGH